MVLHHSKEHSMNVALLRPSLFLMVLLRSEMGLSVFANRLKLSLSPQYIGKYAFQHCASLTDIYFDGTIEQWFDIEREKDWYGSGSVIIHCTDSNYTYKK